MTGTDGAGNTTAATVTLDVVAGTPMDPAVTAAVTERLRRSQQVA